MLTNYYTKAEVDAKIAALTNALKSGSSSAFNQTQLDYLNAHYVQNVSSYPIRASVWISNGDETYDYISFSYYFTKPYWGTRWYDAGHTKQ